MIWNEIKKLLHWKMILLLVLMNAVIYLLFISDDIDLFPNGRPQLDSYNIGIEMVNHYGNEMDETEFIDFQKRYEAQVEEANHYLQSRKAFVEAGIQTYEDFKQIDLDNKEQDKLHSKVMFKDSVDIFWELQERERIMEFYQMRDAGIKAHVADATPAQKARIQDIKDNGEYDSVLPSMVSDNYKSFIQHQCAVYRIPDIFAGSLIEYAGTAVYCQSGACRISEASGGRVDQCAHRDHR